MSKRDVIYIQNYKTEIFFKLSCQVIWLVNVIVLVVPGCGTLHSYSECWWELLLKFRAGKNGAQPTSSSHAGSSSCKLQACHKL